MQPIFKYVNERDYKIVHDDMIEFTRQREQQTIDEIWFVEHNPVFTLGRNGNKSNLLCDTKIPVVKSDRGGDITYHGPGQLIMYCMIDIKRLSIGVKSLVNGLEEMVIRYLAKHSVVGVRMKGAPGVYVDGSKLASLGLRVRHGYTFHGIAINIDMDLTPFSYIHPCGLRDMKTVQLSQLGINDSREQVASSLTDLLLEQFYT